MLAYGSAQARAEAGAVMDHLARIVWKPITWLPESPDQYPDGLPRVKPEIDRVSWLPNGDIPRRGSFPPFAFETFGLPVSELLVVAVPLGYNVAIARRHRNLELLLSIPVSGVMNVFDALCTLYASATGQSPVIGMKRIAAIEWRPADDQPRVSRALLNLLRETLGDEVGTKGQSEIREHTLVDLGDEEVDQIQIDLDRATRSIVDVVYVDESWQPDEPPEHYVSLPLQAVPRFAEAILYIYRRTHEHEFEGPDAGLPGGM